MTEQQQTWREDDSASIEGDYDNWISNFCSSRGREYFVEIPPEFIEDDFNLTGLLLIITRYKDALDVILDYELDSPAEHQSMSFLEQSAEELYGMIHARFILTKEGLNLMAEKYEKSKFGTCPRNACSGSLLLPMGRFDTPGIETVRLYCPVCCDVYFPLSLRYLDIDGAYFGTSFPGVFINTFPDIERQCLIKREKVFDLKLFGFNVSEESKAGPRMKWLRQVPKTEQDFKELEMCSRGHVEPNDVADL